MKIPKYSGAWSNSKNRSVSRKKLFANLLLLREYYDTMLDKNIPNGFGVNERQFRKQSHAIV
jgi:hypothetical protein